MARTPEVELRFTGGKPDPGRQEVKLPSPLPSVGDDFDWHLGDFESYRDFMLSELRARFPERHRWTAADMEQVLIDILAAILDQLSDMADRTFAESFLGTARHPERVYQWLQFIGYNPPHPDIANPNRKDIIKLWRDKPHIMEQSRVAGPSQIYRQKRMATPADYSRIFALHPLVLQARSTVTWGGSWPVVWVTVNLWNNHKLFDRTIKLTDTRKRETKSFHDQYDLLQPTWKSNESFHDILINIQERFRMAGQEVVLRDVEFAGINITLVIDVGKNYFHSEVRREVERVLGRGSGGFFEPKRLGFGEDIHISDFYERLMSIDGVDNARITRFKRSGDYPDRVEEGCISLEQYEIAVCNRDPQKPELGTLEVRLQGGRKG